MSFLKKLAAWGKRYGFSDEVALRTLLENGVSPSEIGDKFKADGRTVRLWMDQWRIKKGSQPKIFRAVVERGFGTLSAYFRLRWGCSFKDMAKELGVSVSTVASYYGVFSQERMEANHGK